MEKIKEKAVDKLKETAEDKINEKVVDPLKEKFEENLKGVKEEADQLTEKLGGIAGIFNFFKEMFQAIRSETIRVLSKEEIMKTSYTIFIDKYRQNGKISKYFYSFDLIRQLLFSAIIVCVEGEAFAKAVSITVLNFLYFSSCLILRPYNEIKIYIETILSELLLLLCSIFVCLLSKEEDQDLRLTYGMVIVILNGIMTYGIMLVQSKEGIFDNLRELWKFCRGSASVNPDQSE
jgi:hypothetical protein